MSPPFIPQQQIHPHFNPTSHYAPPLLPPLSAFLQAVRALSQMFFSMPVSVILALPLLNQAHVSSFFFFYRKLGRSLIVKKRHAQDAACTANEKQQQQLYFPPQYMQMMYSATYNCATD